MRRFGSGRQLCGMLELLRLRALAVVRTVAALGRSEPAWAVGFLALLGLGAVYAWGLPHSSSGAVRLAVAGLAAPVLVHAFRRDGRLLRLSGHPARLVFALDYAVLVAPFAGVLAVQGRGEAAALVLAASLALPLMPAGRAGAVLLRGRRRRALGPRVCTFRTAGGR